nr:TraX family protein [Pseudomonas sp. 51_B]
MFGFYGVFVPTALVLAIKPPELFALLPVALCAAANSRTGLFEQAAQLEPFAILTLSTAALAPLLGLALFWAPLPFKVLPVTQWSYWFYPGHLVALLDIRNLLWLLALPLWLASSGSRTSALKDLRSALVAVALARFVIGVTTLGVGTAAVCEGNNRGERQDCGDHEGNDFHQATPCSVL